MEGSTTNWVRGCMYLVLFIVVVAGLVNACSHAQYLDCVKSEVVVDKEVCKELLGPL